MQDREALSDVTRRLETALDDLHELHEGLTEALMRISKVGGEVARLKDQISERSPRTETPPPTNERDPVEETTRPPLQEPGAPPAITVRVQAGGCERMITPVDFRKTLEGPWIDRRPARGSCGSFPLAVILIESLGFQTVLIANPFENTHDTIYSHLSITWPDHSVQNVGAGPFELQAGQAHAFTRGELDRDVEGAHPLAIENVRKWAAEADAGEGGFHQVGPIQVWGPPNANHEGAAGVYRHILWWAGSREGFTMARRQMQAYLGRQLIVRLDEAAYIAGRLEVHRVNEETFLGHDHSGAYALPGFESVPGQQVLKRVGGIYSQVNGAHRGRIENLASFCAEQGDRFASFVLWLLAEDERLCWVQSSAGVPAENGGEENFVRWNGAMIRRYWPLHKGCLMLHRGFGHALRGVVRAYALKVASYEPLRDMLETLVHCWDAERRALYLIPFRDPIHGATTTQHPKKLKNWKPPIPEGVSVETLDLEVSFETVFIYDALVLALPLLRIAKESDFAFVKELSLIAVHMRAQLTVLDGSSPGLRIIDHPEYSSAKPSLATRAMLGLPGDVWLAGKSADFWATHPHYGPQDDNPLNACAPPHDSIA